MNLAWPALALSRTFCACARLQQHCCHPFVQSNPFKRLCNLLQQYEPILIHPALLLCRRRCWDEYVRFKNCMIGKMNPDQQIAVLPGPHFLWHIRTRKQAAEFWTQHYAHLGAGATNQQQQQQANQQQPGVDEPKLRADVTSRI